MNKYNYSKSVKVTRQSCPRSPSRDFAACSELFQPLACPALVPAMHCENTVAHMAFQCVSHRFTMSHTAQGQTHHCCINCKHAKVYNSYHKTISGKENQSRHDIDPRHHVWSHQMLPLPVTCWRQLRSSEGLPEIRCLVRCLGWQVSPGSPRALQGTAVELLPWPEAKKVHHRRKAGRLMGVGSLQSVVSHGFPGWQVWICKMITSQKISEAIEVCHIQSVRA